MKRLMIIAISLFGVLFAQNGNHIHHLFGLKESTPGLFTLDALDQKTGNSVEIETFSANILLGGNYAFQTINNNVFYIDQSTPTTISFLNSYLLPELYTSSYQGLGGSFTYQGGFTSFCVNPESDSSLFAYNVFDGTIVKYGVNGGAFGFNQGISGFADTNSISMVYYNSRIYLSGNSGQNTTKVYVFDEGSLQIVDSLTFASKYLYLVAHPQLGVYALGQDSLSQNFIAGFGTSLTNFVSLGALPSCGNCLTELYTYDKNALVLDSEFNQLILARSESVNGTNAAYFLSTFDLANAGPVYEIATPERYSNLIFKKTSPDLVYPGDTDHDKLVSMQDLLPIGLFYNDVLTDRLEISTEWIGQSGVSTGDTLANGVDKKHADCNGDGQVNAIDIDAIFENYSYTHYSEKSTNATCDFPMFVNFPSLVREDEPVSIQIGLDLSSLPSQNVYGVIFTIEYDSTFVVVNSMNTQGVNGWFGTENGDYLQVNVDDAPAGKMDVGVVGINKANRTGGGILLDGVWTMEDVVIPIAQGYRDMDLKISNVLIIDFEENVIDACGVDTVIRVYDKNVGIMERQEMELSLYPNPTKASFINLEHVQDLNYVEIYDLRGRLLQTWHENFDHLYIGDFNKSIYFVKAYAKDKVYVNKLVYNKD